MPLNSMTGFARETGEANGFRWAWEMKSVNGKGLDIRARIHSPADHLEIEIKRRISKEITRGSIQLSLIIEPAEGETSVCVDLDLLNAVLDASAPVSARDDVGPASLDGLLGLRGVLQISDTGEPSEEVQNALDAALLDSLGSTIRALKTARADEGRRLAEIMDALVCEIEDLVESAASCDGARLESLRAKFASKVEAMLEDKANLDGGRLEQELAQMAVKADIREELDRLRAHISGARELLASEDAIGRRLDFLSQEFNREANTLCSKSNDADMTRIGLDLKAAIDRMREQVQNIE